MKLTIVTGLLALMLGAGNQSRSVCYVATLNSQNAPSGVPWPADSTGFRSAGTPGAIRLTGSQGYHATLYAGATSTLSGAGTLQSYFCPESYNLPDAGSPCAGVWPRNPGLDETVVVTGTSCNGSACASEIFPDRRSSGTVSGWLFLAPNGVTESAGTLGTVCVDLNYQT